MDTQVVERLPCKASKHQASSIKTSSVHSSGHSRLPCKRAILRQTEASSLQVYMHCTRINTVMHITSLVLVLVNALQCILPRACLIYIFLSKNIVNHQQHTSCDLSSRRQVEGYSPDQVPKADFANQRLAWTVLSQNGPIKPPGCFTESPPYF